MTFSHAVFSFRHLVGSICTISIYVSVFVTIQVLIHPQHDVSIISRTLAAIILITQGLLHNFGFGCKMKMLFTRTWESGIKHTCIFLSSTVFLNLISGVFLALCNSKLKKNFKFVCISLHIFMLCNATFNVNIIVFTLYTELLKLHNLYLIVYACISILFSPELWNATQS